MTPWELRGQEMVNCNCNFGCPCQFSALPTGGSCRAAVVYKIDKGHYGVGCHSELTQHCHRDLTRPVVMFAGS